MHVFSGFDRLAGPALPAQARGRATFDHPASLVPLFIRHVQIHNDVRILEDIPLDDAFGFDLFVDEGRRERVVRSGLIRSKYQA